MCLGKVRLVKIVLCRGMALVNSEDFQLGCNKTILYLGQVSLVPGGFCSIIRGFPVGVYSVDLVSWSGWSCARRVCSISRGFPVGVY